MKKIFKGLICTVLGTLMAVTGVYGCGGNNDDTDPTEGIASAHRDPETAPLKLSIGATDGNYNPLFYTSQNDGVIANMTQISLMTSDADGVLAYGEDYPTVALDYRETYYSDEAGTKEIGSSDGKAENITGEASNDGSSSYEFVIKNGIKFSDGVDLTVMDVLFNLYVYLDPLYSGSATIYSTKIQGLAAYRSQDPFAEEGTTEDLSKYYAEAQTRIDNLLSWSEGKLSTLTTQMEKDLETVEELYKKELESDWNSLSTTWTETYKDYRFTSAWQAFYFSEGVVDRQQYRNSTNNLAYRFYDKNGNGEKEDGEPYLTDFDPTFPQTDPLTTDPDTVSYEVSTLGKYLTEDMEAAVTEADINKYMADNPGYTYDDAKLALQGKAAVDYVYEARTSKSGISYILTYCATASNAYDEFVKDARSSDVPDELIVKNISGITVRRSSEFYGKNLGEEHDILKINVSGVDPKAKWNFSFSVAPMHYYSDEAHTAAAMADYKDGKIYNGSASNFGVQYKNSDFINDVLAASSKTNLPVGAGAYKCTSHSMDGSAVTGSTFNYNKIYYYERNENFETLGSGIENAKIKYVTYKEMSDDKIVNALKTGELDYGTPIAKAANQTEVASIANYRSTTYQTGGYGYVGINPKSEKLRSVYVRQAIMYSLDTSAILNYYGRDLVKLINRPMSITSWASPENPRNISAGESAPQRYYDLATDKQGDETDEEFIRELVSKSGTYYYDESKKQIVDYSGNQLEITFTIAGESQDHPAFTMFNTSKRLLERCGFKINVETSALALRKLTTGDLEVWAAAWSSSIDPDPYQIYSMNSNASSTKNWYKDGIQKDGGNGELKYEYTLAKELTDKIEEGRETLNRSDRIRIYGQSASNKKLYQLEPYSSEFYSVLDGMCTLDIVMEMAVEFPTYQRNELCVYNAAVLDPSTMRISNASHYMGPIDELWKVGYRA